MSEALTVADDMLRSFFERWQGLDVLKHTWDRRRPFDEEIVRRQQSHGDWRLTTSRVPGPPARLVPKGNGIAVSSASLMLKLCWWLTRLGDAGDDYPENRRGFMISCRLTGLGWDDVQRATGDVSHVGAEAAGELWAAHMSIPDRRFVGYVYSAFSPDQPSVVKIGFSCKPEQRMKSLARHYGVPISLGACIPATMLHEWAIHQTMFRQVSPEWYRVADVPNWLMPLQLREAA